MAATPTLLDTTVGAVRREFPALFLLSCLVNLLLLVSAIYMLQIYDRVLSSGSLDTLLWLTAIALFAIAVYAVLEQARRTVLNRAAHWLDGELNAPMLRRAMEARLAGEQRRAGVRDVSDLRNFYSSEAALAFLDAPWAIIFIVFIWSLHPALGVLATLGAAILLALTLVNDALTRNRQQEVSAALRSNNENAIRFVDGGETIAPLGMSEAIFARWQKRQAQLEDGQQRLVDRTTTILSISRGVRLGLQVLILGIGAYYVLQGQITAGAMIAASIILGRALAPIERATGAWRRFVAARTATANLEELFKDVPAEPAPRVTLPRPHGRLAVEHAYYIPAGAREPILKDLNFRLEPGENCAVVGPSGAGKSSLCRLLVGAWKPQNGNVRLDGADVFTWPDLGRHIGYLPQKVELFPGTVAENIARFGEVQSEAIIAAARLAGVHELILALPQGYETEIELHAQRISLGQRQRIALARALYSDPALLVLDEPNANMDEAGDHALLGALETVKERGGTVLVVTHRASVLKVADRVLVLHGGQVARFGSRDELLTPVSAAPDPRTSQPDTVPGPQHRPATAAE